VLPFPFWACRLPLGSSYITFLYCSVPHLSFPFPPAPAFPFDKLLHFFRLAIKSPDACLWKGQLLTPFRSVTLTFRVQISHLAALPNVCIHPPLFRTCGKYMCTLSTYTTLKMDIHILTVHSHFHQALDSPLAPITALTANRAHLGPLDLAPSKIQQRSPSPSPCTSPRRPPLPLTPPLTPSSLNDSASQGGLPATPTDPDSTNAALWRRKSKYLTQKGPSNSGTDDFVGDTTPTDSPYLPFTQSRQQESKPPLSCYLRLDTSPSRFLLVSGATPIFPHPEPLR
jgi:hypothetical protein